LVGFKSIGRLDRDFYLVAGGKVGNLPQAVRQPLQAILARLAKEGMPGADAHHTRPKYCRIFDAVHNVAHTVQAHSVDIRAQAGRVAELGWNKRYHFQPFALNLFS
jgi:hypothetical protein